MKYSNSISNLINTDKFVSKFAYIFLALFAFSALACESNNDDNPLSSSIMEGYISDTSFWRSFGVSANSFGRDSLGKDTILTVSAASNIDGSEIYMFIPYPAVGSFSVELADSTDSTNRPRTTFKYKGEEVSSGTINISRFDTVNYVLEADFNFSFEGMVEGDSGRIDTTTIEFTKGKIKAAYLRKGY